MRDDSVSDRGRRDFVSKCVVTHCSESRKNRTTRLDAFPRREHRNVPARTLVDVAVANHCSPLLVEQPEEKMVNDRF